MKTPENSVSDDIVVGRAREHFLEMFSKRENPVYLYLPRHVEQAAKWTERILVDYPYADRQVVMLSIWLHDIGWAIKEDDIDHAVRSETEVIRFLPEIGVSQSRVARVAHCVRAHRNRDIQPETLEARIVVAADSASHFTDINYVVHCTDGIKDYALGKLERDYRDVGLLPGLQEELAPLYLAWKELLTVFPDYI